MTKEEERRLIEQLASETDPRVRKRIKDRLVVAHLPLVEGIARRHKGRGLPVEDLVQDGTFGLMTAIDKFDLSHDVRLSTYAKPWITRDISHAISNARLVRVPVNEDAKVRKYRRAVGRSEASPTATELGMSEVAFARAQVISTTIVMSLDGTSTDGVSRHELIGEDDDGLAAVLHRADAAELVAKLKPKEARIVSLFYGLDTGEPLEVADIAAEMGVCRKYIHQCVSRAIAKLRKMAEVRGYGS